MTSKVLFVDDDQNVLSAYYRNLHKRYAVDVALGGQQGVTAIEEHGPYAVVVADMRMPHMDGIAFLGEAEAMAPDTVRIMLTGNADQQTAMDAVNRGHVFRFLTKPCSPEDMARTIDAGIHQYQLVTAERELLEKTLGGSIQVLTELLAMSDPHAFGRAQTLKEYALRVAEELKWEDTWALGLAAQLCQIGLVTLPPDLLAKMRSGAHLNLEEQETVGRLPEIGARLLGHIPRLEEVARIILYQNKNYNGAGFPHDGLKGEEIPLGARILRPLLEFVDMAARRRSLVIPLEELKLHPGRYDDAVLEALQAIFAPRPAEPGEAVPRPVQVRDLEVGQVLASDVETRDGMLVVPAGTRLSLSHLEKLHNFARLTGIKEPMLVRDPAG